LHGPGHTLWPATGHALSLGLLDVVDVTVTVVAVTDPGSVSVMVRVDAETDPDAVSVTVRVDAETEPGAVSVTVRVDADMVWLTVTVTSSGTEIETSVRVTVVVE